MYTEPIGDLTVIPIYTQLMQASTAQGSAYLHAKETITSLLHDDAGIAGGLTTTQKAEIVSKTIGDIATSITSQAMGAAIQIAKENREGPYMLAKVRADTELAQANKTKVANDALLVAANTNKIKADTDTTVIQGWKIQADMYSKNGVAVDGSNISVPILSTISTANSLASDVVSSEQAKAGIYNTLASAARKEGNVTITKDASGNITGLTPTTPIDECLSGAQTLVALRQEKGFDDNKVQHAANSSASMIGMLLSTENSSALSDPDIDLWRAAVNELNTPHSATTITKTITITSDVSTVSKAADLTVSGTSTGIVYGSNIEVFVRTTVDPENSSLEDTFTAVDVGIIEEDSTWSFTLPSTMFDALGTGAGEVVVGLGSVYSSVKAVAVTNITA